MNSSFIEQAMVISHGMTRLGRIEKEGKFEWRQNEYTVRYLITKSDYVSEAMKRKFITTGVLLKDVPTRFCD